MMVEVPFAFEVDVIPKGKRRPITKHLMSSVTVDVAVATDARRPSCCDGIARANARPNARTLPSTTGA